MGHEGARFLELPACSPACREPDLSVTLPLTVRFTPPERTSKAAVPKVWELPVALQSMETSWSVTLAGASLATTMASPVVVPGSAMATVMGVEVSTVSTPS